MRKIHLNKELKGGGIMDKLKAERDELEKSVIMHHRRMEKLRHSLLLILEQTLSWKEYDDE